MSIKGLPCASFTRRHWFGLATGAGFSLLAANLLGAAEFWNKKEPSAWTSDEILRLATRSPWAVTARVLPKPGRDRGSFGSQQPDIVPGTQSGNGRGAGEIPVVPVSEVTVVWESAEPLLDALKSKFSSDFANHYVIGVNDLPKTQGKHPVNQANMQASLQARGKTPVDAGAIEPTQNGQIMLFGFSKELFPLTAADKDVIFSVETDQYSIKARFEPKEMVYKGRLAV